MQNFEIREINNKKIWEDFIQTKSGKTTSPTSFIHSWNWGEFSKKMGQKMYRLGVYEQGELAGVALGVLVSAKRGKYIHFRHGPVIDWSNKELVEFVATHLKNLASTEGAWFIRISPLVKELDLSGSHQSQMHDVDSEETWILDLEKPEDELLNGMRKNTRYSIRKAEKQGVEIIKTKDSKYLQTFWEIMQDTVARQKWTFYPFEYIKNEFETFAQDDQNLLFLAKYEGKFIAAAIFNFYHNQSVYHHSGSLSEFRKIPASYLVQWEALKEAKRRGLARHNFWGLPLTEKNELDMSDPWAGVGLFKVGFGGHAEKWTHARDIPVSWKYWLTHYFEKFENLKRKVLNRSN